MEHPIADGKDFFCIHKDYNNSEILMVLLIDIIENS